MSGDQDEEVLVEREEENVESNDQQHQQQIEDRDDDRSLPLLGYRHAFAALGFLGFLVVYFLRVCVSVAVVLMAKQYKWSDGDQGIVLSSFFAGYVILQIPGGSLAEKIGGKWIYGLGIALACVFTMLTPLAAHFSFNLLIFARVLTGLSEGVTFPSMHAMLSRWAPIEERTSMGALVYCGASMGSILAMPVTAVMCAHYGWESVFYMSGLVGLSWCLLWTVFASSSPNSSRFMGLREKQTIARSLSGHVREQRPPVPYKSIWTSPAFFAILIAHISKAYGDYTLLTELPTYMREVLHFPLEEDGFLSALPFVLGFITGIASGILADVLRRKSNLSTTFVRKTFNSLGFVVPAVALGLVGLMGEDKTVCVALLCVAVGFGGLTNAGVSVNHIDIAPNFAGTLLGFTNMAANFCGIVAPYVAGSITNHHPDSAHWRTVFLISSFVSLVGAAAFYFMASGEEQPFNRIQEDTQDNQPILPGDEDIEEQEQEQASGNEAIHT